MNSPPTTIETDRDRNEAFWLVWVILAAFGSYFCMYGLRKPFTAARFEGATAWGLTFKTILVTSQVAGYMVSKFIGIKVIAEMPQQRRALTMLWMVLLAEATLIGFGLIPRPWNAVCLFANGLSLGMVFGLVLGFLEGRRTSELLTAGLCTSFIVADGFTKTVGTWLLQQGISEEWMPSAAGGMFLVPLAACVAMLARIAPPTPHDVAARTERGTMVHAERCRFVSQYAWGLFPLVVMYLAVTIVRSIRADFAPEIWRNLGHTAVPSTFTRSEMLVALGVLAVNGAAVLIVDNRRAFFTSLATCGLGFLMLIVALAGQSRGIFDSFSFMVLMGLGLYLPYVAMHTTVFERLLGMTRERGNTGFLMYVADSIGYLGYVTVMIARNFFPASNDVLGTLVFVCWIAIGVSGVCLLICWRYFARLETSAVGVSPIVSPAEAIA